MDDYDESDPQDEEDSEEQTQAPEAPSEEPPMSAADARKLRKENHSLRTRLRRSELVAKYGETVVDLIPSELPLKKWEEHAEKLHTVLAERVEGQKTEGEQESAPAEPTPSEQALAAVTTTPSAATAPPPDMSAKEILELGRKDPARAEQIVRSRYASQQ